MTHHCHVNVEIITSFVLYALTICTLLEKGISEPKHKVVMEGASTIL